MDDLSQVERGLLAAHEDVEYRLLGGDAHAVMERLCARGLMEFVLEDDRGIYYRTHEGWKYLQKKPVTG